MRWDGRNGTGWDRIGWDDTRHFAVKDGTSELQGFDVTKSEGGVRFGLVIYKTLLVFDNLRSI